MKLDPLPLTVIAGYLGAGKTSLVNRVLAEAHGLRIMVLVNDFGAINIDQKLLLAREGDSLALTNGCVCCTIGADLFLALGDALDRRPRPDHLLVEASGIADPGKIANAAHAEPELAYGGIITVVDAASFAGLSQDAYIGAQFKGQIRQADLIAITKSDTAGPAIEPDLKALSDAPQLMVNQLPALAPILFEPRPAKASQALSAPHPAYLAWHYSGERQLSRAEIGQLIDRRPAGLFRLKGFVNEPGGQCWHIQLVGNQLSISPHDRQPQTSLVGIGLQDRLTQTEMDDWWPS